MIKVNLNLLQMLTINSLNVKHQGKSSNQLAFHLSAYTHLWTIKRAIFQKHTKYKLTVWKIQSLILMIKMLWKRKWLKLLTLVPDTWCQMYCSEYFDVFEYLVWTSHKINKSRWILAKPAPRKRKNYHQWNSSSGNKLLWRWQFQ